MYAGFVARTFDSLNSRLALPLDKAASEIQD
jgi:hypothetical protein